MERWLPVSKRALWVAPFGNFTSHMFELFNLIFANCLEPSFDTAFTWSKLCAFKNSDYFFDWMVVYVRSSDCSLGFCEDFCCLTCSMDVIVWAGLWNLSCLYSYVPCFCLQQVWAVYSVALCTEMVICNLFACNCCCSYPCMKVYFCLVS